MATTTDQQSNIRQKAIWNIRKVERWIILKYWNLYHYSLEIHISPWQIIQMYGLSEKASNGNGKIRRTESPKLYRTLENRKKWVSSHPTTRHIVLQKWARIFLDIFGKKNGF